MDEPNDPLAMRLAAEAEAHRTDPPPGLHDRIMSAVGKGCDTRWGIAPDLVRAGRIRALAAAAALALVVGAVMLAQWRNQMNSGDQHQLTHQPGSDNTPNLVESDGAPASTQMPSEGMSSPRSALAAIDLFLEAPGPAMRDELMQPLRDEFERIASAGDHLLRATIDTLPPSFRGAASGR